MHTLQSTRTGKEPVYGHEQGLAKVIASVVAPAGVCKDSRPMVPGPEVRGLKQDEITIWLSICFPTLCTDGVCRVRDPNSPAIWCSALAVRNVVQMIICVVYRITSRPRLQTDARTDAAGRSQESARSISDLNTRHSS